MIELREKLGLERVPGIFVTSGADQFALWAVDLQIPKMLSRAKSTQPAAQNRP